MSRFLRPTGPGTFDVIVNDEVLGTVAPHPRGGGYRALTACGQIPMPNGSVLSTTADLVPHGFEKRPEPRHATPQEAARMIALAVDTGRILNAQVAYQRANGWSTD